MNDPNISGLSPSTGASTRLLPKSVLAFKKALASIMKAELTATAATISFLKELGLDIKESYGFNAQFLDAIDRHSSPAEVNVVASEREDFIDTVFTFFEANHADGNSPVEKIKSNFVSSIVEKLFPSKLVHHEITQPAAIDKSKSDATEERRTNAGAVLKNPLIEEVDPEALSDIEITGIQNQIEPLLAQGNLQPIFLARIVRGVTNKAQPEGELLTRIAKKLGLKKQGQFFINDPDAAKKKSSAALKSVSTGETPVMKPVSRKSSSGGAGKPPLSKTITDEQKVEIIKFANSIISRNKIKYAEAKRGIAKILGRDSLGTETTKKLLEDLGYNLEKGQTEPLKLDNYQAAPVSRSAIPLQRSAQVSTPPLPAASPKPANPKPASPKKVTEYPMSELPGVLHDYLNQKGMDLEATVDWVFSTEKVNKLPRVAPNGDTKAISSEVIDNVVFPMMYVDFSKQANPTVSQYIDSDETKSKIILAVLQRPENPVWEMLAKRDYAGFQNFLTNIVKF